MSRFPAFRSELVDTSWISTRLKKIHEVNEFCYTMKYKLFGISCQRFCLQLKKFLQGIQPASMMAHAGPPQMFPYAASANVYGTLPVYYGTTQAMMQVMSIIFNSR